MANERSINDEVESGRVEEDDPEEYFSARSHFNADESLPPPSPESSIPRNSPGTENERLNAKIDKLIAALDSGRQVRFERNPITEEFDAIATYSSASSSEWVDELEAGIAAVPENFGTIICSRRQMFRSPISMMYPLSDSSFSSEVRRRAWNGNDVAENDESTSLDPEDESLGTDLHLEHEKDASLRNGVKIRRAMRLQEQAAEEPRGSRLAVIGPAGVDIYKVHPIRLDFSKTVHTSTPSIHSTDSQFAHESPLFRVAYPDMVRYAESWVTESDSEEEGKQMAPIERVSEWLEQVKAQPEEETSVELEASANDFEVFRDVPTTTGITGATQNGLSSAKMLKDVSNIRRPGYLKHNSFAQEKKPPAGPPQAKLSKIPVRTFGGAADADGRRSFIKSKWPGLLSPVPEQNSPASSSKPINHPEQMARFELALARLEGRASPVPGSPIQRYVHKDGVYGEDVEVEFRKVRFRQPRPIRYSDGPSVAQQFEQAVGESINPEAYREYQGNVEKELIWN